MRPSVGGDGGMAARVEQDGARRGLARACKVDEAARCFVASSRRERSTSRRYQRYVSGSIPAVLRIDRLDDGARHDRRGSSRSQVLVSSGSSSMSPCAVADDLHLRAERIGRMLGRDDRDLVRAQPDQVADREQPHQVDEPLEQHAG